MTEKGTGMIGKAMGDRRERLVLARGIPPPPYLS